MAVQVALWLTKRYPSTLISVFLTGFCYFSINYPHETRWSPFYYMGSSPGNVSENPVTLERRKKGSRMSCDVGEATEGLENEL